LKFPLHATYFIVGPRPDWDPDIVATLDDDYNDHCNSLEDDFIHVADGPLSDTNNSDRDDRQGLQYE